jgi:hypothetical protein
MIQHRTDGSDTARLPVKHAEQFYRRELCAGQDSHQSALAQVLGDYVFR